MGARLVLNLARRGVVGSTVPLGPGGFWRRWEKTYFRTIIGASIRLVRALQPVMPAISRCALGRSLLLAQLSADPSKFTPDLVLTEMRSFASSPSIDELLRSLVSGPEQQGIHVVHHDAMIDRMTDGTGAIASMAFAELSRHVIRGTGGERIPTLAEVVAVFRDSPVDLRLEIKTGVGFRPCAGIEAEVAEFLHTQGMLPCTMFASFMLPVLSDERRSLVDYTMLGVVWLEAFFAARTDCQSLDEFISNRLP